MWIALLAWVPLLFGGWFRSCVEPLPPKTAQSDPGAFSRQADGFWRRITLALVNQIQDKRSELQRRVRAEVATLPAGSVEPLPAHEDEMATSGTYGQLPEIVVDQDPGAIFPAALSRPSRYSWYQVGLVANEAFDAIQHFEIGFRQWKSLPQRERIERFSELSAALERIDGQVAGLAQQVRYLSTWVPQLSRQWTEAKNSSRPAQYVLISALQQDDPRLMPALREVLRPARILKHPFLPAELEARVVTLPIATDITDPRFRSEVEGALDTHWNQSSWARNQRTAFRIQWARMPRDNDFARGKIPLDAHLARFPKDRSAMTTGGLTTYVRGRALVLGPGRINPRTLAHELGHLMGFSDCYLRTLSGQGILGTAVLEWDNPLYPDDIMCDNTVGAARAEAW